MASLIGLTLGYEIIFNYATSDANGANTQNRTTTLKAGSFVASASQEVSYNFTFNYVFLGFQQTLTGTAGIDVTSGGLKASFSGTAQPYDMQFVITGLSQAGTVTAATSTSDNHSPGVNSVETPQFTSDSVTVGLAFTGFQPGTDFYDVVAITNGAGSPPSTPAAPVLASDTGSSSSDRITSNPAITYATPASGDVLLYSTDGTNYSTTAPTFATNGTADGQHTVYTKERDAGGQTSAASSLTFTLDTVAPNAPAAPVLANDTGSSGTDRITSNSTVTYATPASGNTLLYSTDGVTYTGAAPTITGDGQHTVYSKEQDAAGNLSAASSLTFTLDTVAPNAPAAPVLANDTGSSNSDRLTNDPAIVYATPASGDTLLYSTDGVTYTGAAPTITGDGLHTVYSKERDAAGNLSAASSLTFTLDTVAPAITGEASATPNVAPGAALTVGSVVTFTLTTDGDVSAAGSSLTLSNGASAAFDAANSTATILVYAYTVAAGDAYTADLRATALAGSVTDAAGNAITNFTAVDTHKQYDLVTAVADTYTVDNTGSVANTANVLANDTDALGQPLRAGAENLPAHAKYFTFLGDGSFTYQAYDDFFGDDSFTYIARNDPTESNAVTVTIHVDRATNVTTTTDPSTGDTDYHFKDSKGDKPYSQENIRVDGNGKIVFDETIYDDGHRYLTTNDTTNAYPWATINIITDTSGKVAGFQEIFDDGHIYASTTDTTNAFPWAAINITTDANKNISAYQEIFDDGHVYASTKDTVNAFDWSEINVTSDAAKNVSAYQEIFDDGHVYIKVYDTTNAFDWSTIESVTDVHGNTVNSQEVFDDGHRLVAYYDPDNSQPYISKLVTVDASNAITRTQIAYDNGTTYDSLVG